MIYGNMRKNFLDKPVFLIRVSCLVLGIEFNHVHKWHYCMAMKGNPLVEPDACR